MKKIIYNISLFLFVFLFLSVGKAHATYSVVQKEIQENTEICSIRVQFPTLEGPETKIITTFNQKIKNFVDDAIKNFKKTGPSPSSLLDISYVANNVGNRAISILFTITSSTEGAAHTSLRFETRNFDLKQGNFFDLAALFKKGSNYLQILSNQCLTKIKWRARAGKFKSPPEEDGARKCSPTPENFKSFTLTENALMLHLPYQLDSYASGPTTLFIPFKEISKLLDPEGPIPPTFY